jgi:hypothetical protein
MVAQTAARQDVGPGKPVDPPNPRVRTRTHGRVTGKAREGLPLPICGAISQ